MKARWNISFLIPIIWLAVAVYCQSINKGQTDTNESPSIIADSKLASNSQSINDSQINTNKLLSIIADPKVDKATLMETIQKLGPVTESAQFWTKITNSDEYSEDHRRFAVFQLFQRHVSPGMTMSELAYLLDNPTWLANKDISIMTVLAGYIPIELTFEDPVFVLRVFHDVPNGKLGGAVYLRVSGQVDMESFIKVLRGETVSEEVRNAKILEFAPSSDSLFTGL